MSQSTVSLDLRKGFAGMLAKSRPFDGFTGVNQESDGSLDFGDPVYISSYADDGVSIKRVDKTAANTKSIDGFVYYDSKPGGIIKNKEAVTVVRKGLIWVKAGLFTGKCDAGTEIYYDISAGKFIQGGTKATGDITNSGIKLWSNVTAAEATAGTKLLLLEVNLPNHSVITS